ncbi:GtrA family protein [Hyphococcus sp.]|jgi:putative flippase GtrA|uniref:GtrA family protein n=1 Tax=Hyphococcus sp. TaxID=2038636 RepID=UPI003D0F52A3
MHFLKAMLTGTNGLRTLAGQLIRFGVVGAINTATTFVVIVLLMLALHWSPLAANAAGYCVGLCVSYFLNKRFTFKQRAAVRRSAWRFVGAFVMAYSANALILMGAIRLLSLNAVIAQGAAAVAYTLSFFVLCKFWVFRDDENKLE